MSDKIIKSLDNDNLPEEYRYMAMYIIDNLVHEDIYDSNKHAIILIEEDGFYNNNKDNDKVWRILIYNKEIFNDYINNSIINDDNNIVMAAFHSQIISIYYDPYLIYGCENRPYFEIYNNSNGDVYRYIFSEYKKLYNRVYEMYKNNIMYEGNIMIDINTIETIKSIK